MKKFIITVTSLTLVALVVVYGEVEAMKTGYDIRQLNIRKRELTHRMKESEFEIATLTAPEQLEEKMLAYRVKLVNPKLLKIAKLNKATGYGSSPEDSTKKNAFWTKLFVTSAQADTTR